VRYFPAVVLSLAAPTLLLAHPGHAHHIMGTVAAATPSRIDVKDMSGAIVPLQLVPETQYLRDKKLIPAPVFTVGDRVMAEAREMDGKMVAIKVWLGTATPMQR